MNLGVNWSWQEERVDRSLEHLLVYHDSLDSPVAAVGPPRGAVFPVEFLRAVDVDDVSRAVRHKLDYYLVEKGERDPWAYALYHCGTMANAYSDVHWTHVAPESADAGPS